MYHTNTAHTFFLVFKCKPHCSSKERKGAYEAPCSYFPEVLMKQVEKEKREEEGISTCVFASKCPNLGFVAHVSHMLSPNNAPAYIFLTSVVLITSAFVLAVFPVSLVVASLTCWCFFAFKYGGKIQVT